MKMMNKMLVAGALMAATSGAMALTYVNNTANTIKAYVGSSQLSPVVAANTTTPVTPGDIASTVTTCITHGQIASCTLNYKDQTGSGIANVIVGIAGGKLSIKSASVTSTKYNVTANGKPISQFTGPIDGVTVAINNA
ncbi:MAG: hypothetical protein K0S08_1967 [Gammaproteobacteria bacterium]|jgi:hypothetical protein|nr:hypothetical protein [Gammaproteobacteria bacterium]